MKMTNKGKGVLVVFLSIATSIPTFAATAVDNSEINMRDSSSQRMTADQQGVSERDAQITLRIRQDIMREDNFSIYAQNIKVITVNGRVTLKGPVRTLSEQAKILRYAQAAAGDANVINEIEVTKDKIN